MTGENAKRWAVPVSVCLIGLAWGASVYQHVLRPGGNAVPPGVLTLAAFVVLKTALTLAVVWPLLRANGETLRDLGFSGDALRAGLSRGALVALGVFLFVNVVLETALKAFRVPATPRALVGLFQDPREAPLWILIAVVGGGFTEELIRAFVLTRFDHAFGRPGLAAAVAVDTAVFALGHLYQGVTGAVQAGASGLLFALVFLKRRRAADAMAVHAFYDLLGIAAAYALYAGRSGRP